MSEYKCDFAVIYNTLVFGVAILFLLFLWMWHAPKYSPFKYHVQVLSKHMQSKCEAWFFSRKAAWTFGSVISQMRVGSSMPAPIPSLLWSTFSPRCLAPAGNEFHVGAFFYRVLTKFGLTSGLRPPSPWVPCPVPCGSVGHCWLSITQR